MNDEDGDGDQGDEDQECLMNAENDLDGISEKLQEKGTENMKEDISYLENWSRVV
jgi:hypothetical protein